MTNRVAYRYALALISEADEKKITDRVGDDMALIIETLAENSLLRAVLATPVIRPHLLENVFTQIFQKHISKEALTLITLLIHKGRGALLGSVAENYLLILDGRKNIMSADIRSSRELDEDSKKKIVEKLTSLMKTNIRPSFRIDTTLRGGFAAKVGDTLIDASLKNQLDRLRDKFKAGGIGLHN